MIYRKDELEEFKDIAYDYLKMNHRHKLMSELCDHLGISRQTLYHYRKRNKAWRDAIDSLRIFIYGYNGLILQDGCLPSESEREELANELRALADNSYDWYNDRLDDEGNLDY